MAKRPGILVSQRRPHPSPPSPNACVPEISVEIRAHWPPNTPRDEVAHVLFNAWWNALGEITSAIEQVEG